MPLFKGLATSMLDCRWFFRTSPVIKSFALALVTLCFQSPVRAQTASNPGYADSPDGFRQQLNDLIAAKKSGDDSAFRAQLDALAIPNANDWIAAHFSPADAAKLQPQYPLFLAGFQKFFTGVIENAAHLPGWDMTVSTSELPKPPATTGPESEIPVPSAPVSVENFRYGPAHPEDDLVRSWVNSFIYIDVRFRYVGGTYPFWSEGLQKIRAAQEGPLQLPKNVQSAHILHKVSPKYPKEARRKHIEGVVRLHAIIDKDGAIRDLTVISGDPLLTEAALKAVRQWRYTPTMVNGEPVGVDTTIDVTFALNY